ncbi:MAG: hypothetical protein EAZ09_09525 [Oscillatoriales cyanobacterium]|nr:MAG: hypothetical protein EAZ18_23670 [Oscillatoriales cyanobacterium]TAH22824.1 MAG: hypothetical protein EAZ09_09525 [Oscillatoriales cyanobacterium]
MRVSSGFGGDRERILARLKNFDFRGTIGRSQKSGESDYTNRAQLGNCLFLGRSNKLRSTLPKSQD